MGDSFVEKVVKELERILDVSIDLPLAYKESISALGEFLDGKKVYPSSERRQRLISNINLKFRVNQIAVSKVYAQAAKNGITFNFHQKSEIQHAFDSSSKELFLKILTGRGVSEQLKHDLALMFSPASESTTIATLKSEFLHPSKLRNARDAQDVKEDILLSALAAFVYSYADEEIMHSYFDVEFEEAKYNKSFWLQLRNTHPELYNRDRALEFINVEGLVRLGLSSYSELRDQLLQHVADSYSKLNNHGYLAVWITPTLIEKRTVTWELASDLMIFAEKFDQVELKKGYFRPDRIARETSSYVPDLSLDHAEFHSANEGFSYRDTFVCSQGVGAPFGTESLLVLLQKNKRDETLVPCPSCRSHEVGGNSYPSLGVKSWECGNLLCPDKSKYNRGKRYSFKSLLMQEAIDDELNEIPHSIVRAWSKDVQFGRSIDDVLEMVVRCYSLHGDSVWVAGVDSIYNDFGRKIIKAELGRLDVSACVREFWGSSWFERYIVTDSTKQAPVDDNFYRANGFTLIHGDARSALKGIKDCYFDAAITSPPYYNAREYSQWSNIYCYMYDMYNIAVEAHRVLKDGALYMYNIFDYFDNENTLAHSAMGNKRIPLSAYTVDAFRRAGFVLLGNVSWDKGDIEGKRGFNAGNFSPYYQAPFNCWEHILVFIKADSAGFDFPDLSEKIVSVLRASPVIKMVGGENIHGHTAPFPEELPELLKDLLSSGSSVLDPFGGSGTTARALVLQGISVTCVEQDVNYCGLAKKLFEKTSQADTCQQLSFMV